MLTVNAQEDLSSKIGLFDELYRLGGIGSDLFGFLQVIASILITLIMVSFIYKLVVYLVKKDFGGEGQKNFLKDVSLNIIALFILFSFWGILIFMHKLFFERPILETQLPDTLITYTAETTPDKQKKVTQF